MNEQANPPLSLKQLQKKIAKHRRWLIWVMGQLVSIEGQATHRIDELIALEERIAEQLRAEKLAEKLEEAPPKLL